MGEDAKFKIGDKVTRFAGDKPGVVTDVMILKRYNGQERFMYKVKFDDTEYAYVPCDLQLFETKEPKNETDIS